MEKLKRSWCRFEYRYQRLETHVTTTSGPFSGMLSRVVFASALLIMAIYCLWTYEVVRPESLLLHPQNSSDYGGGHSLKVEKEEEKKYYIRTKTCEIPYQYPFEESVMNTLKNMDIKDCKNANSTEAPGVVKVAFHEGFQQYIVRIMSPLPAEVKEAKCCYQQIVRGPDDSKFESKKCTSISEEIRLPLDLDFMMAHCQLQMMNSSKAMVKTIQVFSLVQKRRPDLEGKKKPGKGERWPSIIILGIDTMSRINFPRIMPQTYEFVKKDWLEMEGYTKVGDNTFPNLMAILAGNNDAENACIPHKRYLDNCSMLWTDFREAGYYTGYGEDLRILSTFNYRKKGFKKAPTDFYQRAMIMAIEKILPTSVRYGITFCAGNRHYAEYIYDYGLEFAKRLRDEPHFGFFWTNSFSHDYFGTAKFMDHMMLRYLQEFRRKGILDNSIVMLLSDHGARWGPLLKLPSGFYEERLPMFFISIPEWFRHQYPEMVKNLQTNTKRLTSPYDLHMTLQHLLKLSNSNYNIQPALGCPQCVSLLDVVPWNRTCEMAGIDHNWCSCSDGQHYPDPPKSFRKALASQVIDTINNFTASRNLSKLCHHLQLYKIENVKTLHTNNSNGQNWITYTITVVTHPKTNPETMFSSVLRYDVQHSKFIDFTINDVKRQSLYRYTSKCVSNKDMDTLKNCICKGSGT